MLAQAFRRGAPHVLCRVMSRKQNGKIYIKVQIAIFEARWLIYCKSRKIVDSDLILIRNIVNTNCAIPFRLLAEYSLSASVILAKLGKHNKARLAFKMRYPVWVQFDVRLSVFRRRVINRSNDGIISGWLVLWLSNNHTAPPRVDVDSGRSSLSPIRPRILTGSHAVIGETRDRTIKLRLDHGARAHTLNPARIAPPLSQC